MTQAAGAVCQPANAVEDRSGLEPDSATVRGAGFRGEGACAAQEEGGPISLGPGARLPRAGASLSRASWNRSVAELHRPYALRTDQKSPVS